ncbi:NAD(P)-dependent oxidoreductase [Undibacterium seohonense]|uniref:NAD(P)-dependent oxidoreductase n=1 Tax=Undibacterium seohonense TaxID=1344950 RepID=A0ABR6X803_9BURK|nr:NAD(P)-dependent oxidoreductase [Undibacterium seohonense]MBC3809047.1 NAD(P)-dependent oxidoreductase [Undibacterium seohonense]
MGNTSKRVATLVGGHGFIGQHLHRRLEADGWNCWVPEKNDPDLFRLDLGTVFYCAGVTADFAQRGFDCVDAHVSCLNQIMHAGVFRKLVYLSSARLYDQSASALLLESDDLKLNPYHPRHLFDLSKALGESLCLQLGKNKASVARLSCVVSSDLDAEGFLASLLKKVVHQPAGEPLFIESSRQFVRDYVMIDDVVSALLHLAASETGGIYNVASGANTSNSKLFDVISDITGVPIVATIPNNEAYVPPRQISVAKMYDEFGWMARRVCEQLPNMVKGKI